MERHWQILEDMLASHPDLHACRADICEAFRLLCGCYAGGGKVLACGNGGSAADADHLVGELMKGFLLPRRIREEDRCRLARLYPSEGPYLGEHLQQALPALSLVSQSALSSAFANDVSADMVYAQLAFGYGRKGDVLIGISTSGNSANVVQAIMVAKALGLGTIGLTGESGGRMDVLADVMIRVPAAATFRVQEYHLPVYHALCAMLEAFFFTDAGG